MDKKNLTVEEANALIEKNVAKLESRKIPLKDMLEIYTQTCELIEYAMGELNKYQGRIMDVNDKLSQIGAEGMADEARLEGADFYEE